MAEDEKTRPEETAAEAEMRFIEAGSLDMENRDPKNLNIHIAVSETKYVLFCFFVSIGISREGNISDLSDKNKESLLVFAGRNQSYLNVHSS